MGRKRERSGTRRIPQRRWSARVLLLAAVSVALLATLGISGLRNNADRRRVSQVLLARVESLSNRQNVKESTVTGLGVAAESRPSPVIRREIDDLRVSLSQLRELGEASLQDVSDLGVGDQELTSVRESFARYQKVLETQVGLLDADEFTQAFAFDRFRVDQAFLTLQEDLDDANLRLSELARRAGFIADAGTFSVVIGALLGLTLLHKRAEKASQVLEKELEYQAFHDGLTGLANRSLFRDRVEHALIRSSRAGEPVALVLLDLDGFKAVNDSFGHEAGDNVLRAVAERLIECTREADTVARLGGDEFAILLEELTEPDEAGEIAERLNNSLSPSFDISGRPVSVGACLGMAVGYSEDRISFEELLANADMAMYSAKLKGRGRFEIFGPSMRLALSERLEFESDLRRAIENDELVLHYQPIVDLQSGLSRGVEALVRWDRPGRGLVPPGDFIPLAEQTGLIVPLGRWVLRTATLQLMRWHEELSIEPLLRMSVNLSAEEFQRADLVEETARVLEQSRIPPGCLFFEITETALMKDTDATVERLCALKELGVRLAVDDFGTGYSSLSYLRRFPIDRLKIDRSFVANGLKDASLVQTIVRLGKGLGLETVAEGIEEDDQLHQLRDLGCDLGQGYLFARPLPAEEMTCHLASRLSSPLSGPVPSLSAVRS
jgi:diguanylate cyclase (GGDEF)-like protein